MGWWVRSFACVLFTFGAAFAQWVPAGGPDGGPVARVSSNASNGYVFAIANKIPYRSTDNGLTWTALLNNLEGNFYGFEIVSSGTDTYLWGQRSASSALYYSSNYGTTWTLMAASGLPFIYIAWGLGTSGPNLLLSSSEPVLYKSSDHGATFTPTTGIASNVTVGYFAGRGGSLYAGSHLASTEKAIYRSTDDGANWTAVNSSFLTSISPLTGLTSNANGLFAGTGLSGVYRCTDTGQVWTKVSPGGSTDFSSAVLATATNVYSGATSGSIQRADQDGNGWAPVNTGLPPANANESVPTLCASGTAVIAGTNRLGIYRTVNQGTQWTQSNPGLHAVRIKDIMAESGNLFVAGDSNGFFRSTDQGATWTLINGSIPTTNRGFFSFGRTAQYLLGGCGNQLLYRSTNQGTTWTLSNTNLTMTDMQAFWIGAADSVWVTGNAGVGLSTNGGVNWTFQTAGMGLGETGLDILKDGAFMMVGEDVGGCKRSTNSGATWNAAYLGLPTSSPFAYIARIDTVWFITTKSGIYRSYNHGANWAIANTGLQGQPWALIALDTLLYAGTDRGVWMSFNRAATWSDSSNGLPPSTQVLELSADANYVYAGTDHFSVWRRSRPGAACAIPPGGTGDVNAAGGIVSSDIIYLVNHVLKGGPAPIPCTAAGDVNCDGAVATSDIVYLVNFVLKGGPAPCNVCTLIPGTWSCP